MKQVLRSRILISSACLLLGCAAGNASTMPNLLLHWNFDTATTAGGTVSDLSGNNRNGTLSGTALIGANGSGVSGKETDRAFSTGTLPANLTTAKTGNVGYVGALNGTSLSAYTISFWYKADPRGTTTSFSQGRRLFQVTDTTGSSSNRQFLSDGSPNPNVQLNYHSGSASSKTVAAATPADEWLFVALTFDGSIADANQRVTLYIGDTENNAIFQTVFRDPATALNWTSASQSFTFGGNKDLTAGFAGWLDDLRIYDGALSAAQIRAIQGAAIPEPSTVGLALGGAAVCILALRRRRRR